MRTPHGQFPQYHTSADNLDFVNPVSLSDSLSRCLASLTLLEGNKVCLNQKPKCEPRLGKRGLYRSLGGQETEPNEMALLWVLSLSDGQHDLLDIADRSNLEFSVISHAAEALLKTDLLKEC
jgi:aminopeptidase-like protein